MESNYLLARLFYQGCLADAIYPPKGAPPDPENCNYIPAINSGGLVPALMIRGLVRCVTLPSHRDRVPGGTSPDLDALVAPMA